MENPKIVLGLKAEKRITPPDELTDDDGNFFSTSSDEAKPLSLQTTPVVALTQPGKRFNIVGFSDASSRITMICAALKEYERPEPYKGTLNFIPDKIISPNDISQLQQYLIGNIQKFPIDKTSFNDLVCAQLTLVEFLISKDRKILERFTKIKIDSRVMMLINYCLAKSTQDHSVSCYYYLSTLEEFLKINAYPPLICLFPDCTIENCGLQIAIDMMTIFPKHPILPSVLHSLAAYNNDILTISNKVSSSTDSDDDFSDSFFEFVKQKQSYIPKNFSTSLITLIEEKPQNPLDFSVAPMKQETISVSVTIPPKTVTYYFDEENKTKLSTTAFSDWIISLRSIFKKKSLAALDWRKSIKLNPFRESTSAPFLPIVNEAEANISQGIYNAQSYIKLYSLIGDPNALLQSLPNIPQNEFFHLYYPILQILNTSSNTLITKGCIFPNLIELEYMAHNALKSAGSGNPLEGLLDLVPSDPINRSSFDPLEHRRPMPDLEVEYKENIVNYLAAADIELVANGRSPFTCQRLSTKPPIVLSNHPILNRVLRASYLWDAYKTKNFPPFFAFRIGFAAALAAIDIDSYFSCDVMFEIIRLVYLKMPDLVRSPAVRSAVLFFAETLERSDRYYHASLVLDNYFLSDVNDSTSATAIAQIAQRNGDTVRACFFYSESLKSLITQQRIDESLYIGQILAQIYFENGMFHLAISVLSFLLRNSYNIASNERNVRLFSKSSGTIKRYRNSQHLTIPEFNPNPNAINTMLVCCSYIDTLIRARMFSQANLALDAFKSTMEAPILRTVLAYLDSRLLLKSNKYEEAIEKLPNFDIHDQRSNTTHISLLSGAQFDNSTAVLNMMTRGSLHRRFFRDGHAWSELVIHAKSSYRALGYGYFWRGQSFAIALSEMNFRSSISMSTNLNHIQSRYLKYKDENKLYNERELTNESLSCFALARVYFERVGCIRKETEAALKYCDVLLRHFFDITGEETEFATVVVTQPVLDTTCKFAKPRGDQLKVAEHVITLENFADECSRILYFAEKNAEKLMMPTLILYAQALLAKLNLIKNRKELAQTYFDYAFNCFMKYSDNGRFIPRVIANSTLRMFETILEILCDTLSCFDSDFINDRIALYDILNDLRTLLVNRIRNVSMGTKKGVIGSLDMDTEALTLANPKLPSFNSVLVEGGYLKNDDGDFTDSETSFIAIFRAISANIRLFEQQKIDQDSLHMRNKKYCVMLEKTAQKVKNMTNLDLSYKAAKSNSELANNVILMMRLSTAIFTYVPSSGTKHFMKFKQFSHLNNISIDQLNVKIDFSADSFPLSVFEALFSFIYVDKKGSGDKFIQGEKGIKDLQILKESLFGDLLENCPNLKYKCAITPDELPSDKKLVFSKPKGQLVNIDPCVGNAVYFITSRELNGLPLEVLFKENLVFRLPSYAALFMKPSHNMGGIQKMIVFRRETMNPLQLRQEGIQRSAEACQGTFSAIGASEFPKQHVEGLERTLPCPFPLFSSNKNNDFYLSKYKFICVEEVKPGSVAMATSSKYLFVFTYTDLCEMPTMVENLLSNAPNSFFMFIPSFAVRDCFKEMSDIVKRNKERQIGGEEHLRLLNNATAFVAAMQMTLMKKIHAPIPVFMPKYE
ncbi:hypothetical protein TVAG_486050 [Trichomonas vaginalis G3]|uniref:Uncharacterized protein n=1 Tax=Trichomonas vaginalis (strain ATCC PRA-98 / G3) TaxID=412133 RepID=A2EEF2_TRIV3|nr:hypothetical protein TVAGG3_0691370 [Trichomonas vaginalis G3]EAY08958.1 hypothetical protein TVAG_486050 [Trichomonas vaginalis G3]KAI5508593.1 hypothetical protein TVAGG3_0691370 [Trichomonas vaginalis G3]|eukprot:XP_001321181.1 hypothetical protein [Trichomonas vaginalis G3]